LAPGSSYPFSWTNVNGTLYFTAFDGTNDGLWKSDGTSAGTVFVKSLIYSGFVSVSRGLTNVNGTLYFLDSPGGLWKTDGTPGGTTQVTGQSSAGVALGGVVNVNNTLFTVGRDSAHGAELWKTDGTAAGTVLVKDIAPGPQYGNPVGLANVGGVLLFSAFDANKHMGLWKSDGTSTGTVPLTDSTDMYIGTEIVWNGRLYFAAIDALHGLELWTSDGTASGTRPVADIAPHPDISDLVLGRKRGFV